MSPGTSYYAAGDGRCPVDEFLDGCPTKVSAQLIAVLDDVADAPPPRYSGGGRWEAMHRDMGGFYEVRAQGPSREQFRLFCILENGAPEELARRGLSRPAIAVITGLRKPWMTAFSERDYESVRRLGDDHRAQFLEGSRSDRLGEPLPAGRNGEESASPGGRAARPRPRGSPGPGPRGAPRHIE